MSDQASYSTIVSKSLIDPKSIANANPKVADVLNVPLDVDFDTDSMINLLGYDTPIVSKSLKHFKRAFKEVAEVNADFHTLRTYIWPSNSHINLFYFVMMPNDGAMAHQKLIGRMFLSTAYPDSPPVVHLFTPTGRYNIDIFRGQIDNPKKFQSSMCFDILKSKQNGGVWEPTFTISALFAALMQALVSMNVEQQYGADVQEFVSMEKLAMVKQHVSTTLNKMAETIKIPALPEIPLIEAIGVKSNKFVFPQIIQSNKDQKPLIISSNPIYLQNEKALNHTVSFDLSGLHEGVVFSVVLSNSKVDMIGQDQKTILVRNGVTGSAAKKKANDKIRWFYHGIPLNSGSLKVTITVAHNQFTIVYWDSDPNSKFYNKPIVHGDTPISFLTKAELGDVSNQPFFLNIFLKKKSGAALSIKQFDTPCGYIHSSNPLPTQLAAQPATTTVTGDDNADLTKITTQLENTNINAVEAKREEIKLTHIPTYVAVEFSKQTSQQLFEHMKKQLGDAETAQYKTFKDENNPAHITVIFNNDKSFEDYCQILKNEYLPNLNSEIDVEIIGYGRDPTCVAFVARLPANVPVYPVGKKVHITMALSETQKPVYSNTLLTRLSEASYQLVPKEELVVFSEPLKIKGVLKFVGKIRLSKEKQLLVDAL
jgi:ubiquitin-protein ligase